MDRHSTEALVSIIINSAVGGNKDSFKRALTALQGKPATEMICGLCSITINLQKQEVGEYFINRIEEISSVENTQLV